MTSKTLFKGTLSRAMNKLINAFSTKEDIIKYGGFFFAIYQNSRCIYPFGFLKLKSATKTRNLINTAVLVVWYKVLKVYFFKLPYFTLLFKLPYH